MKTVGTPLAPGKFIIFDVPDENWRHQCNGAQTCCGSWEPLCCAYCWVLLCSFGIYFGRLTKEFNTSLSNQEVVSKEPASLPLSSIYENGGSGLARLMAKPAALPEMVGDGYKIYCPYEKFRATNLASQLVSPPEVWVKEFEERILFVDSVTINSDARNLTERARAAYLEFMRLLVTGVAFGDEEKSGETVINVIKTKVVPLRTSRRDDGTDWPYLGVTMTGKARIKNVRDLIISVVNESIPGDYAETGVWRGGNSLFARAVLRAYGEGDRRSFVCDSFRGLPPSLKVFQEYGPWDKTSYLEVSDDLVSKVFVEGGVMDPGVVFVKGFFNDSMPVLSKHVDQLAILRLDGDMYQSTVDVLYHLYGKVCVGGYVIVDDWTVPSARRAINDFFLDHKTIPEMVSIDNDSVYWRKHEEVEIQYWRYQKNQFGG